MAEPWLICFFVYLFTDHCMQSWNAAFLFLFYWLIVEGGKNISGLGFKLNCAGRVGSDRIRRSRESAGFGFQF